MTLRGAGGPNAVTRLAVVAVPPVYPEGSTDICRTSAQVLIDLKFLRADGTVDVTERSEVGRRCYCNLVLVYVLRPFMRGVDKSAVLCTHQAEYLARAGWWPDGHIMLQVPAPGRLSHSCLEPCGS